MAFVFTQDNFSEEVLKEESLVVVDFYADWCGPCQMMGPIVEELSKDYEGSVKIGKLNVDQAGDISAQYKVMSIPSILFFKKGEVVDTVVGAVSKDVLQQKVEQYK